MTTKLANGIAQAVYWSRLDRTGRYRLDKSNAPAALSYMFVRGLIFRMNYKLYLTADGERRRQIEVVRRRLLCGDAPPMPRSYRSPNRRATELSYPLARAVHLQPRHRHEDADVVSSLPPAPAGRTARQARLARVAVLRVRTRAPATTPGSTAGTAEG